MAITVLLSDGVGIWGIDVPVMWGFAIVNFVWWIGIGHAGTLISAILLLLKQDWRTSINRFAEAMTLFAVACAGLFPLLHLGRPWLFYWLLPYPNTMGLWPQWRSPLDLGRVRRLDVCHGFALVLVCRADPRPGDLARSGQESLGPVHLRHSWRWAGGARRGTGIATARPTCLMAGLATPLVVSVHTVVALDFTVAILPGWHSTIFPPYFVAGAIFSGFAMVVTLAVPLRAAFGLHDYITDRHLDNMAKVMLATGMIVAYGYLMEAFMAWYGHNPYEKFVLLKNRPFGPYAHTYWMMLTCNVFVPQLLWSPLGPGQRPALVADLDPGEYRHVARAICDRRHQPAPRFSPVLVVRCITGRSGTTRRFTARSVCSFRLMFLFIRFLPVISITEMRELVHETQQDQERQAESAHPRGATP